MKQWWAKQTPRQQGRIAAALAVAALIAFGGGISLPLHRQQRELDATLRESRAALATLEPLVKQLEAQRANALSAGEDLTTRIAQTLQQHGLQPARMQQDGSNELQLRVEGAEYRQAVAWLAAVEALPGISLKRVSLTPGAAATTVVTVSLARY